MSELLSWSVLILSPLSQCPIYNSTPPHTQKTPIEHLSYSQFVVTMAIDTDLRNSIVDAYSANLNYTKPLLINLGTSLLDISSAVGSNPSTPKGATDQPLSFPPGSVYRFPKQYTGKESWKSLFESLRKCCADCKLKTHRKHQQKKKTAHLAYDIRCSCYFLNQNDKSHFSDRCFTKDNTRIVRNKKTNSNHSISVVDRMSNSKLRGKNVKKASRSN